MTTFNEEYKALLSDLIGEVKESDNEVYIVTVKKLFKVVKWCSEGVKSRKEMRQRISKAINYLKDYRYPKAKEVTSELNNLYTLV